MHDPMVVAFELRRPWPRRSSGGDRSRRWATRYPWRRWYDVRPRVWMSIWTLAGRSFYWPALLVVWHIEPGGRDSGTVCLYSGWWRWHVHHWRVQVPPLQDLRRRLLTRCAWCGGPSRKGDAVNVSHRWDGPRAPWWRGEQGLFHMDCSSIEHAHRACTCGVGPWDRTLSGIPYGVCANCGKHRGWSKDRNELSDQAMALLASIPQGERDRAKAEQARHLWKRAREVSRG